MPTKQVSQNVSSYCNDFWEFFARRDTPHYEITGKYLFFASNRDQVIEIAIQELEHGGFHFAKVPMPGKNLARQYVLCLYYKDDGRKDELAMKYNDQPEISYRYWKSNKSTANGEYSDDFLQRLSPELRRIFTHKKTSSE